MWETPSRLSKVIKALLRILGYTNGNGDKGALSRTEICLEGGGSHLRCL